MIVYNLHVSTPIMSSLMTANCNHIHLLNIDINPVLDRFFNPFLSRLARPSGDLDFALNFGHILVAQFRELYLPICHSL